MGIEDNKRYLEMELAPGVYVPDVGLDYPVDDPLFRMLPVEKVHQYKNDETYRYLEDRPLVKLVYRFLGSLAADYVINFVIHTKYGLRVEGREVLKKYRKELSGSYITVSNHCFRYDAVCVRRAIRRRMVIPMLADLFESKNWFMLTCFGGIPLSNGTLSAQKKFNEAFDEYNRRGEVIHVFAEARSWPFYKPLRPFQKGSFTWAYKWNCPILPVNLSYRPRTGIYKLLGSKEIPLITVRIGEPVFPDTSKSRKDETERLLVDTHEAICKLGGIIKNPWPPIWNEN